MCNPILATFSACGHSERLQQIQQCEAATATEDPNSRCEQLGPAVRRNIPTSCAVCRAGAAPSGGSQRPGFHHQASANSPRQPADDPQSTSDDAYSSDAESDRAQVGMQYSSDGEQSHGSGGVDEEAGDADADTDAHLERILEESRRDAEETFRLHQEYENQYKTALELSAQTQRERDAQEAARPKLYYQFITRYACSHEVNRGYGEEPIERTADDEEWLIDDDYRRDCPDCTGAGSRGGPASQKSRNRQALQRPLVLGPRQTDTNPFGPAPPAEEYQHQDPNPRGKGKQRARAQPLPMQGAAGDQDLIDLEGGVAAMSFPGPAAPAPPRRGNLAGQIAAAQAQLQQGQRRRRPEGSGTIPQAPPPDYGI